MALDPELAAELFVMASTLEDRASRIEDLAELLVLRATNATWRSETADRFRAASLEHRSQLRQSAQRLRVAGSEARALALQVAP